MTTIETQIAVEITTTIGLIITVELIMIHKIWQGIRKIISNHILQDQISNQKLTEFYAFISSINAKEIIGIHLPFLEFSCPSGWLLNNVKFESLHLTLYM